VSLRKEEGVEKCIEFWNKSKKFFYFTDEGGSVV